MEVIASFQGPSGTVIRVIRGDARECPADVAIFGKNRDLRRELVRESGREFENLGPYGHLEDMIDLGDRGGPWRWAVSIRYVPRRIDPYQPSAPSCGRLSLGPPIARVWNVIHHCHEQLECRSFVLMALSWRYPELNSLAVVHAVIRHTRRRTKPWELRYGRPIIERIDLVDREDPTPFVRALRDEGGCMSRAGLSGIKFREV